MQLENDGDREERSLARLVVGGVRGRINGGGRVRPGGQYRGRQLSGMAAVRNRRFVVDGNNPPGTGCQRSRVAYGAAAGDLHMPRAVTVVLGVDSVL